MFSSSRVNFIVSDEGFSVEGLGRTGLRYSERGKTMRVDSELLAASSPRLLVIYARSIRNWDPPYSAEVVDEETKNRIIENIRAAHVQFDYTQTGKGVFELILGWRLPEGENTLATVTLGNPGEIKVDLKLAEETGHSG